MFLEKNVAVKSSMSGMLRFFASAQYEVNSKELLVLLLERDQAAREKAAEKKQAAAPKPVDSNYNYDDVALWLSEKYDFTQTVDNGTGTTMFSTAVKDVDMAKLAIKNALKGSNARMGMPWRLNSDTQMVETGYTVDDHVLVFAIGKNDDGNITVTIVEVSDEQFEQFKQNQIYNNK